MDRLNSRLLNALTVFGYAVLVGSYFWFIHHFGVNAIWNDQWDDIQVIAHPSLGNLWTQHNEARIFFPNLIVVLLAHTTRFNIVVEDYLSGSMLVVAVGLFILSHKRRSPATPWLYYFPVVIVMLSFVQNGNTLFGFQMAWYLVMLALASALFLLDRPTLNWLVLTGAIAAAVVGSLSLLQGLLIWPAGLVLLHSRHRSKGLVIAWIACATTTGVAYFYHLNSAATTSNESFNLSYVFTHPIAAFDFFFSAIGDIVGDQIPYAGRNDGVIVFGVAIFAIAIWVSLNYGRRSNDTGSPIGVALICFGVLFAATLTAGRTSLGLWGASASRYTTFDLLILVGCYVALLDQPTQRTKIECSDQVAVHLACADLFERPKVQLTKARRWDDAAPLLIRALLAFAIFLLVILGTRNGLVQAKSWHQTLSAAGDVTVNIDKAPDGLVENALYPSLGFISPLRDIAFIRKMAQIANKDHLSLFATSDVSRYRKQGLPVTPPLITRVVSPSKGARLKGREWLLASASDNFGPPLVNITKVEFRIISEDPRDDLIRTANDTEYGWLYVWNTTGVPDGIYTVQSVAYYAVRKIAYSADVAVTVQNNRQQ